MNVMSQYIPKGMERENRKWQRRKLQRSPRRLRRNRRSTNPVLPTV